MIYKAVRTDEGPQVTVHRDEQDAVGRPLPHIFIHSKDGFEWGYGGSGPADLALAILAHHLGEGERQVLGYWKRPIVGYRGKGSQAVDLHQDFKCRTVVSWPQDGVTFTSEVIQEVIDTLLAERASTVEGE
jgi:hypothetical protein